MAASVGVLSRRQRRLARHALGLPNSQGRSYRNHYAAASSTQAADDWWAMVDAGFADRARTANPDTGQIRFWLTDQGARLALDPGEVLDPEDFPGEAEQ